MITATITAKGQITIPAKIRRAMKLDVGDVIGFEETRPGHFAVMPVQKAAVSSLKGMFGKPKAPLSIAKMNAIIARRGAAST